MAKASNAGPDDKQKAKQKRVSQGDMPQYSLEQSISVARALWDNYAGHPTAPHEVAIALDTSPTSSAWRVLTGAAVAYGVTQGAYNANTIELTELGRRIVAPTEEGDDQQALLEAVVTPKIAGDFFRQYNRAKWPRDDIAANVLVSKGIPKERANEAVKILKENGSFTGIIRQTKTGPFVSLDSPSVSTEEVADINSLQSPNNNPSGATSLEQAGGVQVNAGAEIELEESPVVGKADKPNSRVFITHGKDRSTMEQIKQVVELGGFEPVVSVQRETAAKGLPDKVMDDMRSCGAAVIHVSSEASLTDSEGNSHSQINPNVLIEIGAAMALYRYRFILVVEEGLELPSNLQGLYQSRYSGSEMSFEAGMKILKALRGLKTGEAT